MKVHHPSSTPASNPVASASAAHEQLQRQSQQWVSQTFFGTLLRQMRNSPFHSDMFEGGQGGQAFTQMFDQRLAEHMARGAGHKLVDSMVKKIEKNMKGKAAGTPRSTQLPRPSKRHDANRERRSYVPTDFRA